MEMNTLLYREIISSLPDKVQLRHDVDFSPLAAYTIARIDYECDKKPWFYFRAHAYPLWIKAVNNFSLIGNVGIHIDTPETTNPEVLIQILENAYFELSHYGHIKKAFTFHRNNKISASFTQPQYHGFLNHNLCPDGYVSDARGIMPDIPKKGVLNLHPEWWVYPGKTPKEKIEYYFNQKIEQCLKEILPD